MNPEEVSYGNLGKIGSNHKQSHNKYEYYNELKRQIEEKQKRIDA